MKKVKNGKGPSHLQHYSIHLKIDLIDYNSFGHTLPVKMASSVKKSFTLGVEKLAFIENFETLIKERLLWTKQNWKETGESGTSLNKLVNSMRFWSNKLRRAFTDKNVIIAIYSKERYVKLDYINIIDALSKLEQKVVAKGFSDFRNPRYISVSLESIETKNYVIQNLKKIAGCNVAFLHWALTDAKVNIRAHWLPLELDSSIVRNKMEEYFDVKEEERVMLHTLNGDIYPSGKIQFKGVIRKGKSIEEVPHLMIIEGFETLITIQGRLIKCLNCGVLGHKSSVCPTPFCFTCNEMKVRKHVCELSNRKVATYAQKVKQVKNGEQDFYTDEREELKNLENQNEGAETKEQQSMSSTIKIVAKGFDSSQDRKEFWHNGEPESDDSSDEKEEPYNSEVYEKLRSYCSELNKLTDKSENDCLGQKSLETLKEGATGGNENMDTLDINLKRKLEHTGTINKTSGGRNRNRGNLKSYGGKKKSTVAVSNSDLLFDTIRD